MKLRQQRAVDLEGRHDVRGSQHGAMTCCNKGSERRIYVYTIQRLCHGIVGGGGGGGYARACVYTYVRMCVCVYMYVMVFDHAKFLGKVNGQISDMISTLLRELRNK